MIGVQEARDLIGQNCVPLRTEKTSITASLGRVLVRDIVSPIPLPLFANSAMDGFVLDAKETQNASPETPVLFRLTGDLRAGDVPPGRLKPRTAKRIMTGAPVPDGENTAVLEKEKAVLQDGFLAIKTPLECGRNVRYPGEELKKGELAIAKDTVVNAGTVGFLATMGIHRVNVYGMPKVSIITTGSELLPPGASLRRGKIYDSNQAMLQAALHEMRIPPFFIRRAGDEPKTIRKVVAFALRESNVVVLTGGVSVGEYDHVKSILAGAGVQTVFWKVRQKPGKPLYFGKKGSKLVFGLPGNPASVFICFYQYVYPAIRKLMGYKNPYLPRYEASLRGEIRPDSEKSIFMKGLVELENAKIATPLSKQQSHMLSSLSEANALLVIPGSSEILREGDSVLVDTLP